MYIIIQMPEMKKSSIVNAQKKAQVRRRVGTKEKLRSRPKRALSAFVYFTLDRRMLIKEREPTIDPKEIMRRMGTDWKQRAMADKERFRVELDAMTTVTVPVPVSVPVSVPVPVPVPACE